jgi:uncharacterized protein (TIGR02646 family)
VFNTIRTPQAPASLSQMKSWSEADVVQELRIMFHDKCYICETSEPLSLNVEHFDAHQNDNKKMFDWNNLFYSCARCNNIKRHYFNNLINCTDEKVDALRKIRHAPPATPYTKSVIIEPMDGDIKTIETASLISKIFNDDNTANKEVTGAYLRKRVYKQYAKLMKFINVYIDDESLPRQRDEALEKMRYMMKKTHEYSAFLRWAALDAPELLELVEDAID